MQQVSLDRSACYLLRQSLFTVLAIVVLSVVAFAQGTSGIVGTVTDPAGAAVPGVKITIISQGTGFVRTTESNATGSYSAPDLPIGAYRVRAEANGFKGYEQTNVTLNVNSTVRIDILLQVGDVKESITVEANALAVQADTNEVSQTITDTQVSQLATNGRNVIQLAALVTGAASSIPDFDSPMAQNQNRTISYNGQRPDHNAWIINGGEAYDRGGGGILIVSPSQDAIQEFKVMTSNYGADMGQASGGMVSLALKGGTRQFHGAAWEYFRNDKMDARSFFANLNNVQKAQLRYNTFGFNLGGPVPIGKDRKTFFFYNMEWRRLVKGGENNSTAVPAAYKTGDFSGLSSIVYAPNTGDPGAISRFGQVGVTAGSPFPNNKIPASLLDPNALLLVKAGYWPDPNTASGRFFASTPNRTMYREETVRMDHQFSNKLTVMGSLIYDNGTQSQSTPLWTGSTYPTVGSAMVVPSWQYVAHATYTISPSLLNDFAFNSNGNNMDISPTGSYTKPTGYNVKQLFTGNTNNKIPTIAIQGAYGVTYDPGSWPWANTWRSYQWKDDLAWIRGTHNFKFGGSYMFTHKNQDIFGNTGGSYTFDGTFTKGLNTSGSLVGGDAFADFLLGYSKSYGELMLQDAVHISNHTISIYAMDDWRATKRLTLNLGLRWEGLPHAYDTGNRLSNFYPELYSSAQAPTFLSGGRYLDPNGPGFTTVSGIPLSTVSFYMNGIGLAGRNGIPKGLVDNHWNTFAPRVGFAFDVTGRQKTVLRGGLGMFFERLAGNEEYTMGPNPPFSFSAGLDNVQFSNPAVGVDGATAGAKPSAPGSFQGIGKTYKIPTAIQYSLGIQHQLAQNAVLTMSYVGNQNHHQSLGLPINTVGMNNPNRAAIYAGTYQANLDRPYKGWSNVSLMDMCGNSNYHSMQVSFRTTAWKNLTIASSYTWSHAMDLIDGELFANISNPYNAHYDYGSAGFDKRHMLITSFVYSIPAFKDSTGLKKKLLGGWELSGIANMVSGSPLSIGSGSDNMGLGGQTTNRANVVAPVTYQKTRYQWFSTSSFATPAVLQWGNAAKDLVVGPGRNNWNLAMFKAFQLTERAKFEFRLETFNTFNHTQWSNPNTGILNTSAFGTITGTNDPRVMQLGAKMQF